MQGEAGVRHRFDPVQRDSYVAPMHLIDDLARWCGVFHAEGMAPEEGGASAGNLSFRTTAGFVITPTRSLLKSGLTSDDFVEVVRIEVTSNERFRVHYLGGGAARERVPSSDACMHHLIYAHRPDVAAVFHGHDRLVLAAGERLGVPVTAQETQFGTLEDARSTARELARHDYLIRRNHGFVAVGRTMDHAGRLALDVHRRAAGLGAR